MWKFIDRLDRDRMRCLDCNSHVRHRPRHFRTRDYGDDYPDSLPKKELMVAVRGR